MVPVQALYSAFHPPYQMWDSFLEIDTCMHSCKLDKTTQDKKITSFQQIIG